MKFKNKIFFETGTYQGDTIERARSANIFETIYTMELSPFYASYSTRRFEKYENIHVIEGNSRTDLWKYIKEIDIPITFWLDGHWSGVANIGIDEHTTCPVLYELDQIKQHGVRTHTIMIDDIRLMDGDHFPVTRKEIEGKLKEINSEYILEYFSDDICEEDVLVAHL
jgi:hypothetical protein